MSLPTRDIASLVDMRSVALELADYVAGFTLPLYLEVRGTQQQVERCLEVLGEAARRVSEARRSAVPDIPWADIVGLRNVVAHQYDRMDQKELWVIATERVPALVPRLDALLATYHPTA